MLHGGGVKLVDPRNDSYFRTLTQGLADGDTLLLIGFARRDEAERTEVFERQKGYILAQAKADITVVNATPGRLIAQLKAAKAVHITGGETSELISDIRRYPDFVESLRGKIVGGSSAGAMLFAAYSYSHAVRRVIEGLGTLPLRLMVHYGSQEFGGTDANVDLLRAYPDNLELLTIAECAWVTREADI